MMTRVMDLLASPVALVVAKSCVVLLVAACAAQLMRRRTAAERHLVWTAAIVVVLLLPVFAGVLPSLSVPVRMSAAPVSVAGEPAPEVGGASGVIVTEAVVRTDGSQPSAVRQRPTLRGALLIAWLGGVLGVLVWIVIGRLALQRLLRRSRRLEDATWSSVLKDARWLLDVRQDVRLHVSEAAAMPMTWGIVRPVVLLPADAERWDEDRRRVVLLHELSHVLRYDCLTQLAAYVACALHWFNPLVWHAAQRMRVERERACDALVLSAGTSGADYAAHLLALAQGFRGRLRAPLLALQMARPSQLEGRLLAVLKASHTRSLTRGAAALIAALALLVALPVAALRPVHVTAAPPDAGLDRDEQELAAPLQDSLIERTLTVGSGRRVLLDLRTGGRVDVRGWDDDRVHVAVQLAGPDRRASAVAIEGSPEGAAVVLWQTGAARTVSTAHRVTVRVPRRFDVEIRSAGGAVALHDVNGTFRGHTGGGDIRLDALSGRVELMTGGGAIHVTGSRLDGRVTTASGDITLSEVSGDIVASSGNGRVIIDRERGSDARSPSAAAPEARPAPGRRDDISISTDGDSIARVVPRLPLSSAAHALTTRDRRAAILLRDSTIVVQFTDEGLEQLGRNTDELNEKNFMEALIAGMLRGGLRMILDRGIEYSLRDLHEARYSDGRLVFESVRGHDVFADMNLNGGPLMAQFDAREARVFAQRVNAARARLRR